ncbi:MAG TPA: squalene/phytoene synthase family protein, partial [Allocoleopsis sp.]
MINSNDIFKRGSKTYYYSSIFFDKKTKNNVSKLYAFVRVADDFVDSSPSNKTEYLKFKKTYYDALQGKHLQKTKYFEIIIDFILLSKEFNFNQKWIDAFFKSMDFDLEKKVCKTRRDVDNYIHGSAEVIGLMMSRILKIEPGADEYSKKLGKAMQVINFIRDIKEDYSLNRLYIPDFYSKKLFKINQCLD